jgi:hypothetical protein
MEAEWGRVGRTAGYLSGGALLVGTILYLLDATNALGTVHFTPEAVSPIQNQANFWVAAFAHQHDILWDVIARDTLFPFAFLALIVLALAVRPFVAAHRPDTQLMIAFFVVGGVISMLNDLIYLGATDYWRLTGWSNVPAVSMVAAGRSENAIESLTRWPEAAGFVVLAAALVCLGNLCRSEAALPTRLAVVAYVEAALLIGIALAGVMEADTPYNVFSLLTGALVGPVLAAWLGWHLGGVGAAGRTPEPVAATG